MPQATDYLSREDVATPERPQIMTRQLALGWAVTLALAT